MLVPEFILPYLVLFTMFCLNWSPVVKLYTYILPFIFSALCHCKVLLFLSPLPSNAAHYLFFMQITDFPAPPPPLFSLYKPTVSSSPYAWQRNAAIRPPMASLFWNASHACDVITGRHAVLALQASFEIFGSAGLFPFLEASHHSISEQQHGWTDALASYTSLPSFPGTPICASGT